MARAGLGCAPRSLQATTHARSARLLGLLGVLAVAFGGGCRRFPRHLHDRGPRRTRGHAGARAGFRAAARRTRAARDETESSRSRVSPRATWRDPARGTHCVRVDFEPRGFRWCAYLARRSGETERASVRNQTSDALTRARDALFLTSLWITLLPPQSRHLPPYQCPPPSAIAAAFILRTAALTATHTSGIAAPSATSGATGKPTVPDAAFAKYPSTPSE